MASGLNLSIENSTMTASHFPLTEMKPNARIVTDAPAGSSTLSVININGFAVGQYVLLEAFGTPTAEIVQLHAGTAPTGTTLTLAATTAYDHAVDCPVTVLPYNQVEFNSADTPTGSKTILVTTAIQPNRTDTAYLILTSPNSTFYGFFRFKNATTSIFSDYSSAVYTLTGNPANSVEKIIRGALQITQNQLNDDYSKEGDLINDVYECQQHISELRDWQYELEENEEIDVELGQVSYDLSVLEFPTDATRPEGALKYVDTKRSFVSVKIGNRPMYYRSLYQIEQAFKFANSSTLTTTATVGATTVTLANSKTFEETGSVYLGVNGYVSYTANDKVTGILSGIDPTAIVTALSSGSEVWQNINPQRTSFYTVYNGELKLASLPQDVEDGVPFKLKYLKKLAALTNFSSVTPIPFYESMKHYVAYKIYLRKQSRDEAQTQLDLFTGWVNKAAAIYEFRTITAQQVYVLQATQQTNGHDSSGNWYN